MDIARGMTIRQVQFVNQLDVDIDAQIKPVGDTLIIVLREKGKTGIIVDRPSSEEVRQLIKLQQT